MTTGRCDLCGANLALVGRVHRCVRRAAVPTNAVAEQQLTVANRVVNTVANSSGTKRAMTSTERSARWRTKHREKYNAGMRDLMRCRRAAARAVREARLAATV